MDLYDNPAGINLLLAVDEFGRTVPVSGANKKDRAVGIMYWLWHGSYANRAVDTTKIIEEKGLDYALYNLKDYNPTGIPAVLGRAAIRLLPLGRRVYNKKAYDTALCMPAWILLL